MVWNHQSVFQPVFLRRDFSFGDLSATKSLVFCNDYVKISIIVD
jgi:hypothetical protein